MGLPGRQVKRWKISGFGRNSSGAGSFKGNPGNVLQKLAAALR
jgi:hypothetical protein